ncbi:response regulator [Methanolobus sp. ZRKC3]|uniref:response regulator n=1 Tax=Methanolobus sp. ZRKC3 TaxID=3125786 RepID=UPI0032497D49
MKNKKIMIVEDEKIVAMDIKDSLENFGYSVPCMASKGEDALKMAEAYHPDLILMDIVLKGKMDGVETARIIHDTLNIPIIYLTAYSDEKTLQRAKMTAPFGHILKPFEERELRTNIEIALHKNELEKEKLFEKEKWITSILNNIGDAIITTDPKGKIKLINPLAQALTGYREEEALGKNIEEIFKVVCEDTGEYAGSPTDKVLKEGSFYGLADQTILISKNDNNIPVDILGSPINNRNNETIGTVIIFYDIKERKDIEKSFMSFKTNGNT